MELMQKFKHKLTEAGIMSDKHKFQEVFIIYVQVFFDIQSKKTLNMVADTFLTE